MGRKEDEEVLTTSSFIIAEVIYFQK